VQDHRQLRVWDQAQDLCVQIYRLSAAFPVEERYGLVAQIRRAAVSVGSNIAEASRRASRPDKARILNVAQCEGAEVMSGLDIAGRLRYPGQDTAQELIARYDRLEAGLERLRQRVLEGGDDLNETADGRQTDD
jgi:four helix bundle protein